MFELKQAQTHKDFEIAAELFKAYESELGISLDFQNFDQEILDISKQYSSPEGILLLAYDPQNKPVGCTGVRKLDEEICELKRMFLKKNIRGQGLGRALMMKSLQHAKELGYQKMRLDTLSTMEPALKLYRSVGFYEIKAYRYNPFEEAVFMEIKL